MTTTAEQQTQSQSTAFARRRWHWLAEYWRRWRIGQRLGIALVIATILASLLTYAVFTGYASFLPATPSVLLTLLNIDLILFLAVGILVARRAVLLWQERRQGIAGSGLHVRLVALFSLIAGVPAVIVTSFSVIFLHFGLQSWFSEQVDAALKDSLTVAEAYVQEHSRTVARDALAVARDLERDEATFEDQGQELGQFLSRHLRWRALQAAVVFSADGTVSARVGELGTMAEDLVPDWAVAEARKGEVAVVIGRTGEQLRALVQVANEPERFLYIARAVDQEVLRYVGDVRASVSRFQRLQADRADIELTFGAIFAVMALMLVLLAIWFGLAFAGRLARPIAALVEAAERVRAGDLEVKLADMGDTGEFQLLGRTFNRMTTQLRAQRQELVEANRQLDQRRRFTEAVLAGVAAGVVGLDRAGRIRFPNRMASQLLGIDLDDYRDKPFADVLPAVGPLIDRAYRMPSVTSEGQITRRAGGVEHTFLVRVTAEGGGNSGSVATFTDITDLLDAQREAAWSDIARRIAHEIKNPLTPIQLSAERLKRRYLPQVTNDPETFELCTDTIVRQVDGLRRLVDEFSDFARLPAPQLAKVDLLALAREALALHQSGNATITMALKADQSLTVNCDAHQISRVLTNLLQNAVEAIERRTQVDEPGRIVVTLAKRAESVEIIVADNGAGLPGHLRGRLADPYVTTRAKGTGLGLAIVQKIVSDHGGSLTFDDRPEGGAIVTVTIASGLTSGLTTERPIDGV